MKVKELIEALSYLDPNYDVYINISDPYESFTKPVEDVSIQTKYNYVSLDWTYSFEDE